MKHELLRMNRRKGQKSVWEYNFRCTCGTQGKWQKVLLLAEGGFDIHAQEEKDKDKNPEVQRVQELRRSSAAGTVKRDIPRSQKKQELRLEWFE